MRLSGPRIARIPATRGFVGSVSIRSPSTLFESASIRGSLTPAIRAS